MTANNWKFILICFSLLFLNTKNLLGQQENCSWITEFAEENGINVNDQTGNYVLFFCENIEDEITLPVNTDGDPYIIPDTLTNDTLLVIDAIFSYTTDQGLECEDWSQQNGNYAFSVDFDDPCMQNSESITIDFNAILEDQSEINCSFDIEFHFPGNPVIDIDNYNTDEQIVICEENTDITLYADSIGTSPNSDYVSYQWYVNGDPIPNSNSADITISNTNYDLNSINTFYFTVLSYCTPDTDGDNIPDPIESELITVSIYEGYDGCEPCTWWGLPDAEKQNNENSNNFFAFSPNGDDKNDYFPEKPNNEENRTSETFQSLSYPTCEATTYRVTIYNRLGRTIFESSNDNHPWDGTSKNGKACKEGTYFYKLEYVLNPTLEEGEQGEKKLSFGSVQLVN